MSQRKPGDECLVCYNFFRCSEANLCVAESRVCYFADKPGGTRWDPIAPDAIDAHTDAEEARIVEDMASRLGGGQGKVRP